MTNLDRLIQAIHAGRTHRTVMRYATAALADLRRAGLAVPCCDGEFVYASDCPAFRPDPGLETGTVTVVCTPPSYGKENAQ
jgi:hypothetical protein